MSPRLFICISTGQNIANVAPLLAAAKPGECILFLSSPGARQGQWTAPALEVLKGHGFVARDIAVASDGPASFAAALAQLPALETAGAIVFVANGGSKLQALAVHDALRKQTSAAGKPLSLLYSDDRTVRLIWSEQGIEGTTMTRPYPDTPLCLADVLRLRRKVVATVPDAVGKLLYAAGDLTDTGRAYAELSPGYGEDAAATQAAHATASHKAALSATFAKTELPRWKQVAQTDPEGAERVRRTLAQTFRLPHIREAQLESLYNFILKSATQFIDHQSQLAAAPHVPASDALGPRFERAVFTRLSRWLDKHRPSFLQSVHANVRIANANKPSIVLLEADVLLLLKNGLLIMIEAKSHTAEFKDLDARIVNLHRSASELARLWVCSPLYTAFSDADWFGTQHNFAERVQAHGLVHIPFTLPQQPSSYAWPRRPIAAATADDESASSAQQRTYRVESFETTLTNLLKPFGAS